MKRRARHGRGLAKRFARFVRALFSSEPRDDRPGDEAAGGLGVREPRRPRNPSRSGAVALEAPPEQASDVWAVGDEGRSG